MFLSRYPQAPKALAGQGRYGEAVTLERETLDIKRCVLGHKHPRTARSTYGIGGILARKGDRDEALSLLREAVDDGLPPNIDLAQRQDQWWPSASRALERWLRPNSPH